MKKRIWVFNPQRMQWMSPAREMSESEAETMVRMLGAFGLQAYVEGKALPVTVEPQSSKPYEAEYQAAKKSYEEAAAEMAAGNKTKVNAGLMLTSLKTMYQITKGTYRPFIEAVPVEEAVYATTC